MTTTPEQTAKHVLELDAQVPMKGPWRRIPRKGSQNQPLECCIAEVAEEGRKAPIASFIFGHVWKERFGKSVIPLADLIVEYRTAAPELARVCLEMARELESAKRFLETVKAPNNPTEAALLVVKGDGIIRGIEAALASFRAKGGG